MVCWLGILWEYAQERKWIGGVSGSTHLLPYVTSLQSCLWTHKYTLYSACCHIHRATLMSTAWSTLAQKWDYCMWWVAVFLLYTQRFLLLWKHNGLMIENKEYFSTTILYCVKNKLEYFCIFLFFFLHYC